MSDLIERQKVIDAPFKKFDMGTGVTWIPLEYIEQLPSAQTEIIHCRECKHHRRDNTGCYYCVRKEYGYGWGLNDFCSDAERIRDEGD